MIFVEFIVNGEQLNDERGNFQDPRNEALYRLDLHARMTTIAL
jgi:hypothetical protein